MQKRVHFAVLFILAAALPVYLTGCGSQQAGANAGASPSGSQVNQTITAAADSSAGKPRPKLLPGAKTKVLARAGDRPYDKTFDDLRFEMTPGAEFQRSMLTKSIEAMHGQKIRIRGYILPGPQRAGIRTFVLVRDNQECCFGPGAALYDCILVDMNQGKTAEYSIRPIAVEGIFHIKDMVLGGKHLAIYHMDAESIGGS
jgi:hypothetical protein